MALTLELAPEEEVELAQRAHAEGIRTEDFAHRLIAVALRRGSTSQRDEAAIAMLREWREEAAAMTEEEAREAEADWRETMRDLDQWRSSPRKLFPELAEGASGASERSSSA